jgi:hypothetical protein
MCIGRDVEIETEPISETDMFDGKVSLDELQLLVQRQFLRARRFQREAEKLTQRSQHLVGALRVGMHERGNCIEGVEEKMRLKLHFERFHARFRKARFQTIMFL